VASRGEAAQPAEGRGPGGRRQPAGVGRTPPHQLRIQLHVLVHTPAHRHHGRHVQVSDGSDERDARGPRPLLGLSGGIRPVQDDSLILWRAADMT
jgi:hypothetical protein